MPVLNLRLTLQRWALLRLQALATRRHRTPRLPAHLAIGERGEFEAMFHLRRLGYLIVERRWRSPELRGDLDLIAYERNPRADPTSHTLCFIEVKARTARDFAPAQSAVDDQKKAMLRRMARAYRRTLPRDHRQDLPIRFDVLSVYLLGPAAQPRIEYELLRNAFPFIPDEALTPHF